MDSHSSHSEWLRSPRYPSAGFELDGGFSSIELQPLPYASSTSRKGSGEAPSVSRSYNGLPSGSTNDFSPLLNKPSVRSSAASSKVPRTPPRIPLLSPATAQSLDAEELEDALPATAKAPPEASRSMFKTLRLWTAELVAAALVTVLLAGELILFAHYDHKFIFPEHQDDYSGKSITATWPFSFKINAAFALVTAFIEAGMAFFVASCIGQMRWHWYRRKAHRLDWLDVMTEARAPHGAAKLLFRPGMMKQFATLGAAVIVLAIFMSTFTQQAVNLVTKDYPPDGQDDGGGVSIQTAYGWYTRGSTNNLRDARPLSSMTGAIQTGFGAVTAFTQRKALASTTSVSFCGGTTCDFDTYQSIAVCGGCSTRPLPIVQSSCRNRTCASNDSYTLATSVGAELSLEPRHGLLNLTSDGKYPVSKDLKAEAGPLIARFIAMTRNGQPYHANSTTVNAWECATWWCVRTYSSKMINGTLAEQPLYVWTNQSAQANAGRSRHDDIILEPPDCTKTIDKATGRSSTWLSAPPNCSFLVYYKAHQAIQNYLVTSNPNIFGSPFLTGGVTASKNQTYNITSFPAEALLQPDVRRSSSFNAVLETAWQGMMNRMTADIRYSTTYNESIWPGWQSGPSFTREQAFEVEWHWLAFPFGIFVASMIFLAVTIIINRHDEIWKSSVLAIMFHSFHEEDRKSLGDVNTAEAMKAATRKHKVRMERGTEGQWLFRTRTDDQDTYRKSYRRVSEGASAVVGPGIGIPENILPG